MDPQAMSRLANTYPARMAKTLFGNGDEVKEVKILKSTVRRADPDRRKIDWLWEGEVSVMITQKTGEDIPVSVAMLFHLSPDGEEYECCGNVTFQIGAGINKRFFLKSPWKDWFQEQVSTEWNDLVTRTEIDDVNELRERFTYKYRVSDEEFDEILHPDSYSGFRDLQTRSP
jgi:hypothetical protein